MPELQLDDISLHYEIAGQGPPMLLIAGFSSDSASWGPLVPLLQDEFTLIMPDNRTTGRTVPWDAPTGLNINAKDCLALLQHLGLGPAHVLGHSMGGMIALVLAGEAAPGTVARMTIMASAPRRMPRNVALFQALLDIRETKGARPDLWLQVFYPWLFKPSVFDQPELLQQAAEMALSYPYLQSVAAMRHQLKGLEDHDFDAMTRDLGVPTQALIAEHDLLIFETDMRHVLAEFGDPSFHVIADAGHSLHWDQPDTVAGTIRAFHQGDA